LGLGFSEMGFIAAHGTNYGLSLCFNFTS
jgi:hypothetical protein